MMLSKSKNNTPLSPAEEGILKKLSPALKGSVVIIKKQAHTASQDGGNSKENKKKPNQKTKLQTYRVFVADTLPKHWRGVSELFAFLYFYLLFLFLFFIDYVPSCPTSF